jgi:hypothetical protein
MLFNKQSLRLLYLPVSLTFLSSVENRLEDAHWIVLENVGQPARAHQFSHDRILLDNRIDNDLLVSLPGSLLVAKVGTTPIETGPETGIPLAQFLDPLQMSLSLELAIAW